VVSGWGLLFIETEMPLIGRVFAQFFRTAGRLLTLAAFLFALAACTIVPINPPAGSTPAAGGPFNADQYVNSIWDSKVIPTVNSKAVDLPMLLAALKKDPTAAQNQYGVQTNGAYNFIVKGQGKVTKVDTSTPDGLATVQLQDGQTVQLQVGPLINGVALRDAMGFIQFGDFKNQIDYGAVSGALDDRVAKDVVGKIKPDQLVGKTVSFQGVFTLTDPSQIVITPVKLQESG
jgi:predicted lipoprotein